MSSSPVKEGLSKLTDNSDFISVMFLEEIIPNIPDKVYTLSALALGLSPFTALAKLAKIGQKPFARFLNLYPDIY